MPTGPNRTADATPTGSNPTADATPTGPNRTADAMPTGPNPTADTMPTSANRTSDAMLRVALCQCNLPVGDVEGNLDRIGGLIARATDRGADLTVFPELSITGYPPEDLLLNPRFTEAAAAGAERLAASVTGTVAVVGLPALAGDLHNAAAVLAGGEVAATYRKHFLPNYAVFDEQRYFARGDAALTLDLGGVRVGVTICEDLWYPGGPGRWAAVDGGAVVLVNLSGSPYHRGKGVERERMLAQRAADYGCFVAFCNAVGGQDELVFDGHSLVIDPAGQVVARGAQFEEDLLVVDLDTVSATRRRLHDPRWRQAGADRDRVRSVVIERPPRPPAPPPPSEMASDRNAPVRPDAPPRAPDETASDENAPVRPDAPPRHPEEAADDRNAPVRPDAPPRPPEEAASDGNAPVRPDAPPRHPEPAPRIRPLLEPEAEVYRALTLGTADYFRKNRFRRGVLGLSGGIDSALALAVAADALGPGAVTAVSMPSRFTAPASREDAREAASRLGVELLELPIADLADAYDRALAGPFGGAPPDVAEENLQARIRGNLLMALSNKFGWLVLTTGNKSEMSVGYATLYGDMAGGFAVLKDVLKGWVYRLARWRNREREVIPKAIIDKAPTAELRENQLDTDSLPPYDALDAVLQAYVEEDRSPEDIAAAGHDPALVARIVALVDRAEYKRRQAPPGVRISVRAFGRDRRLPITNRYRTS